MEKPNKICKYCGRQYYKPPCFSHSKYCCDKCSRLATRGRVLSTEWRQKISEGIKRNLPRTVYKKGQRPSKETEFKKGECTGKNHPNWNGGIGTYKKIYLEQHGKPKCDICGAIERIHIHHKDGNRYNGDIDNLVALCITCHYKSHRKHNYDKKCEWCGKDYYTYRKHQRFCSIGCGLKHSHRNVRKNGNTKNNKKRIE